MTATEPPLSSQGDKSQASGEDGHPGGNGSRPVSGASGKSHRSSKGAAKGGRVPSPDVSAKDNPAADMRNMRRIIAEDPDWSLATVPLLVDLCVKHIVENFECKYKIMTDVFDVASDVWQYDVDTLPQFSFQITRKY